ncbi:Uncharacterised protein [Mycobacteroides abscessus]|nr:Uncharacterised protein [Mycobacteroides abscessus]
MHADHGSTSRDHGSTSQEDGSGSVLSLARSWCDPGERGRIARYATSDLPGSGPRSRESVTHARDAPHS